LVCGEALKKFRVWCEVAARRVTVDRTTPARDGGAYRRDNRIREVGPKPRRHSRLKTATI